jgi:Tfp pilus assembly protein PilZ
MTMARGGEHSGIEQRRSSGLLRVPFVRRCQLEFDDGRTATAFVVNLNVLGAYVASDDMPSMGEGVICRFSTPDNEIDVRADGVVAWVNPHQSHPVHSLPPGFGIRFERLTPRDRGRIESVVRGYVGRHAQGRR